jgi:hypothetical protein
MPDSQTIINKLLNQHFDRALFNDGSVETHTMPEKRKPVIKA